MRDWIRLVEDAENHGIKLHFDDGMVEMVLNGKKIGWFTVDVTHKAEGCVSIHSSIDNEYRNKGYGKIAYDWVENWAKSKGLRLIPSDRLSPGAYALWKSRDPSAVADFEVIDYFIDRNGKRHGGLEKLWYSPYAIEKYNLREGALAEKIERLPIKGESNDEVTLYSNCRKAEIKRALASASYGTLRGGWSNGLVLWDANDATHQEVGKSLGGIGHVFILGRSIDDLLQEADWDCDGTLYEAGIGGFPDGS